MNLLKTESFISIRKKIILKQSFIFFKDYFVLFNVNEHLPVPFVELARGGFRVNPHCFFYLHWITCLTILTVAQA